MAEFYLILYFIFFTAVRYSNNCCQWILSLYGEILTCIGSLVAGNKDYPIFCTVGYPIYVFTRAFKYDHFELKVAFF